MDIANELAKIYAQSCFTFYLEDHNVNVLDDATLDFLFDSYSDAYRFYKKKESQLETQLNAE